MRRLYQKGDRFVQILEKKTKLHWIHVFLALITSYHLCYMKNAIIKCSRNVFCFDHQTICLMILSKSDILKRSIIRCFSLSIHKKFLRWSDNMSDDFEQIIRHFAKSSAMSHGPMAFREHCDDYQHEWTAWWLGIIFCQNISNKPEFNEHKTTRHKSITEWPHVSYSSISIGSCFFYFLFFVHYGWCPEIHNSGIFFLSIFSPSTNQQCIDTDQN